MPEETKRDQRERCSAAKRKEPAFNAGTNERKSAHTNKRPPKGLKIFAEKGQGTKEPRLENLGKGDIVIAAVASRGEETPHKWRKTFAEKRQV